MALNKTRGLFLGGFLGLAALGCNTTLTLDDNRLEQAISSSFQAQAGVAVTSVDCPGDRPLKTGDVFTCSAVTADGTNLTITVTQTDDQGNVHWAITGQS